MRAPGGHSIALFAPLIITQARVGERVQKPGCAPDDTLSHATANNLLMY